MLHKFIENVKNIDKKIVKVIILGLKASSIICLFSIFILALYHFNPISHIFYESGLKLFQASVTYAICFFCFGFFVDILRRQ